MQSWRDTARQLDINGLESQLYADIGEFDITTADSISFNDGIVTRLGGFSWTGTADTDDQYFSSASVLVPENIEWCDCHKHVTQQNKVDKIFKTIQKGEYIKRLPNAHNFTDYKHNFAHGGESNENEYLDNYPCHNMWDNNEIRPTKWHLRFSFYDGHAGDKHRVWIYPDDRIIRVVNARDTVPDHQHDTMCNWRIYNDYCRGEGFSPMTREQFEREIGETWTWDVDKPKQCYNHEICSKYNDLNDYMPDFKHIAKQHVHFTKQDISNKLMMLGLYEVINYPDNADDYVKKLVEKEYGENIFDGTFFYSSMANSITHRLARDLKVYVKKQENKHLVSFNDISVLLDYLEKKYNKIKGYQYQEKPLTYILDNLLTIGTDDMPLLREYILENDIN